MPGYESKSVLFIRDSQDREAVAQVFHALELPIPVRGEIYPGLNGKDMAFLDMGLVINATPRENIMVLDNPHALRPLFTRQAGNYQVSIFPGVQCPAPKHLVEFAFGMFEARYGIKFYYKDAHSHNLGVIPTTDFLVMPDIDPEFVTVDPISLKRLTYSAREVLKLLDRSKSYKTFPDYDPTTQQRFYEPLTTAMKKAWPEKEKTPSTAGLEDFRYLCREFHNAGKLVTPWMKEENSYGEFRVGHSSSTTCVAHEYAQKLKKTKWALTA